MVDGKDWARAFSLQANADFEAWQASLVNNEFQTFHRLQLLQMTCEKLAKASIAEHSDIEKLTKSHKYISGPLPRLLRKQLELINRGDDWDRGFKWFAKDLAREIELLNPQVDDAGKRPDNCEYPWIDLNGDLRSPPVWKFDVLVKLNDLKYGKLFVKLLGQSVQRVLAHYA